MHSKLVENVLIFFIAFKKDHMEKQFEKNAYKIRDQQFRDKDMIEFMQGPMKKKTLHEKKNTPPAPLSALCSRNFQNVKLKSIIQKVICHSILREINLGMI